MLSRRCQNNMIGQPEMFETAELENWAATGFAYQSVAV